ncbi:MAG: hypothetical protein WAJ93_22325 [Candidatus Nitrosopolaris sp.]
MRAVCAPLRLGASDLLRSTYLNQRTEMMKNEIQSYIARSIIVKKVVYYLKEENFKNAVAHSLYNGVAK